MCAQRLVENGFMLSLQSRSVTVYTSECNTYRTEWAGMCKNAVSLGAMCVLHLQHCVAVCG